MPARPTSIRAAAALALAAASLAACSTGNSANDTASGAASAASTAASKAASDAASAATQAGTSAPTQAASASSAASEAASTASTNATDAASAASPTPSKAATTRPATPGGYTLAEVAKHSSAQSCWVAIKAPGASKTGVYDLTKWIGQHPGGPEAIQGLCGTDGTQAFIAQHGRKGPDGGPEQMLATFKIGTLAG